MLFYIYLLQG
nr:unnamed protein product [Callosobruchus analis]